MAVLGLSIGLLSLARAGQMWFPSYGETAWLTQRITILAIGLLLGGSFIVASILAIRNRRSVGLIFLISGPIVAVCVAYPNIGFASASRQYFYTPSFPTFLGLSLLFFAPFILPIFVFQNKKRALWVFLVSAATAASVFYSSPWTGSLLPTLATCSAVFAAFGMFWCGTDRLGWPALVAARPQSLPKRITSLVGWCCLIAFLDVALTVLLTSTSPWIGDCGRRELFTESAFPGHVVFTAKIVRTGHTTNVSDRWIARKAIGVVQDRILGGVTLPHFVLLTHGYFWENTTYFIDGMREEGLLTRFLPIISSRHCGFTAPIDDAQLEMRVLKENSRASGPHIIGYVRQPEPDRRGWVPAVHHMPMAGAKIILRSSSSTLTATTDQQGIYQVDDLPPDDYVVNLASPELKTSGACQFSKQELLVRKWVECDFHLR